MTPAIVVLLGGLASAGDLEVGLDWTHQSDVVQRGASTHRLRGRVGWSGTRWGLELVGDLPLEEPTWTFTYSPFLPIDRPEEELLSDRRRAEAALTWTPARGTLVVAEEVELGVAAHLRLGAHLTEVGEYLSVLDPSLSTRSLTAGPLVGLGLEVLPVSWLAVRLQTSCHLRLEGDDGARLEGVTTLGLGVRI